MKLSSLAPLLLSAGIGCAAFGADWPQWGHDPSRNVVSDEKHLPAEMSAGTIDENTGKLDPTGAKNVNWSARLGTFAFGNPTVAGGKVFVGTNNENPRDPKVKGDYALLYCLD